ncbi:hypothetical protein [Nocardiopsis suaedae]|uniref:Uncharacterized protein n=1 Tax=Nocardiopsis suaedae TaxID=3018444 RepID=A0ABT4TR66_9ACTN|nr:hypothetical protein [Nocardiopsis suaedae]MDA2807157.1 hypothetical protein [Nocardiopsis suaedae]
MDSVSPATWCSEDLDRIRDDFPDWRIWRSRSGKTLVATRLVDDDVEPTIVANSSAELRRKLRSPGKRAGRVLTAEQVAVIVAALSR